tara:strand:- start:768 stop:1169 length:402 start_codon:yes stop_codon:yes gene_type:complete
VVGQEAIRVRKNMMTWKSKRKIHGKNKHYSILRKLKRDKKTTEEFEVMLASLSLEEIIAMKLELASKTVGGKLYGLPLWHSLNNIAKEAVFKYVISASRTKMEAARFLGITKVYFNRLYKRYDVDGYFNEQED